MSLRALFLSSISLGLALGAAAQQAPPSEPHEALAALNALQVDPAAAYSIAPSARINLRRGDAKIMLEEGVLAFLAPLDGHVTGAVFSGRGHLLAAPRDPVEKQQIAYFLGSPVIDQDFSTAYVRFTDDTLSELLREFQSAKIEPQANPALAAAWHSAVAARNRAHSLRILSESFSAAPQPYFAASFRGGSSGTFDFVYDLQRGEPQVFGQVKSTAAGDFYDVWSSFRPAAASPPAPAFQVLKYQIESTIHADNSIAAEAHIRVRASRAGERLIPFQFSESLSLEAASADSRAIATIPGLDAKPDEKAVTGANLLYALLPDPPKSGDEIELLFRYRGTVIRDAGNGVLFVSSRDSWYPRLGDPSAFAAYDLIFHYPRRLRLAATGAKVDEREDGELRTSHWRTENPASVAGFNLGEYAFASLAKNAYSIDVYANRQLEQALLDRLHHPGLDPSAGLGHPFGAVAGESGLIASSQLNLPMPEPSPADALKKLARDIDSSVHFYETYSGPLPVHQLSVSQIPGTFGQGWPGLLYISTFSFLPTEAQQRAGLTSSGQEHFHDLVPFHEVAHQWWGNVVGWSSYRDQWIDEAVATYLSLLFADSQKVPDHKLRLWLDRFRKQLVDKGAQELDPADLGSLDLGSRLSSSRRPDGFDELVYNKGAWVIHMLREMLREPNAKNPDARFIALLRTLQTKYAYRALSTADLQHEVEAVMTPSMNLEGRKSMEWFFADWIRGTGIPHYRIEYSVKSADNGFVVRGKLQQTGVADSFVAPVPIYSAAGAYLGRVIAGGPATPFRFVTAKNPGKLLIDPQMTLLCVTER